jgi:hypothetical protein
MGQTRYYNLAFFDFGDRLNSSINVRKEIDRFVVIDKQLYGMYQIFGNGVIDGFNVSDAGFQSGKGISVNISEGTGVIDFVAAQNEIPGTVTGLPPNTILSIYATIVGATYLDRTVKFIYSTEPVPDAIALATVSTGADSILPGGINNNVRDLIGFEEIIQEAINEHKHRGTPTKIDLETEVRNQLPGSRLEGIDASKVVSGRFDIDRIPLVDHNDLEHNGMLNHAALDSYVRTFSQTNKELLGEINMVNLLRMIIFHKYKDVSVDEFFINELALLPGISPNEFIDFTASTANIDLDSGCISGIPSVTGIFTSVFWNDTFSFNTNTFNENVLIDNDTVFLDASDSTTDILADFSREQPFEEEMIIIDSDQQAVIVPDDDKNNVGQFGGGGTLNYFYRINYEIGEHKDWEGEYDQIVIKIKATEQVHEPVYMYVVNGSNINSSGDYGSIEVGDIDGTRIPSSSWEILAKDENSATLLEKSFNINELGLTDVSQITIFTSDSFTFEIDDLEVRRTNIIAETGKITFQYSTEASLTFHTVFFDVDTPSGTGVFVRLKTASTTNSLSTAFWTQTLNSGDVVALTGSAAEIEVVMTSDETRTISPVLNSIELRLLTDANFTGFVIDTEDEWARGTVSNIDINPAATVGKDVLNISTPINVGGRYFAKAGSVSENNDAQAAVYGFSGAPGGGGLYGMPISPVQARYWNSASTRGFKTVSSVVRRFDNSFLVADMENNRVLQVDRNGNLVKGFGSTYSTDTDFYPLSAVYNPTNQILSATFTKAAVVSDITKISLFIDNVSQIALTSEDTVLSNNKSGNRVLEIQLGDDTAVRLLNATSDNLTVDFDSGAFTDTIIINEGMAKQGNAIFSSLSGLVCFVGDFTFIDNIKHPVGVYENSENNWMILNSSIYYGGPDQGTGVVPDPTEKTDLEATTIPSIVEIDPNDVSDTTDKLISSDVTFSDYTLGGIYEYTANQRFVVAGIEKDSNAISVGTGQDLRDIYEKAVPPEDVPLSVQFRADGVDALSEYVGRLFVIDKVNNKKQAMYSCPDGLYASDVDRYADGDFIISESALADASGRLVKIDSFGNINWTYGSGTFHIINDSKVISDDSLIISV